MAKRQRGGPRKYCRCANKKTCPHHWIARLRRKGEPRRYVDLTDTYPNDPPDVAAAKARHAVNKPVDARLTLEQVVERFAQTRTYLEVLKRIEINGVPLGKRVMADITGDDIERAADVQQQGAAKNRHGGLSARRHLLANARYLWNWAIKKRMVKATPFKEAGVAMIKVDASRPRKRRLEGDEEARLLAAADPWLKDMMIAALETSCRSGELRSLQWADVQDGWIVIRAHKAKTKRERPLAITPDLKDILDRRRKGPDGNDHAADAYVFGDETGKMIKKRSFNRRWRALCESLKIQDLNFHDLRHESASQLLEAGAALHHIQATLGHTTMGMTGRYLNSTKEGVKEAAEKRVAMRRRNQLRVVGQ